MKIDTENQNLLIQEFFKDYPENHYYYQHLDSGFDSEYIYEYINARIFQK